MEVRPGVAVSAGRARATVHNGLVGFLPAGLGEVDAPAAARVGHDRHAVAADAGRHRAVEGVDAERHAAHEVVDVADAEEVPRALRSGGLELLDRPAHDLEHLLLVLAERAADRDPARAARGDLLGRAAAQVLLHAALDDPVDDLPLRPVLRVPGQAAIEPAVGALGRAGGVVAAAVERRALV